MDHITDVYTHEPAIALLYFLVFLVPFAGLMFYMIRQHNRWKKQYASIYRKLWVTSSKLQVELQIQGQEQLGGLITDEALKTLERDLSAIESKAGIKKQAVIAATYSSKPEKLKLLNKRVQKAVDVIEKAVA